MNFFAAQDQARRASRRLVGAYVLATVLIVAGVTSVVGFTLYTFTDLGYTYTVGQFVRNNTAILAATALITALIIVGGSMFKTAVLSSGGGAVDSGYSELIMLLATTTIAAAFLAADLGLAQGNLAFVQGGLGGLDAAPHLPLPQAAQVQQAPAGDQAGQAAHGVGAAAEAEEE